MRLKTTLVLGAILFGVALSQVSAQDSTTNIVDGTISKWHSSDAVAGAVVQLQPTAGPQTYVVHSGSDGRFQFRNIPDGDYSLSALHPGFVQLQYGKKRTTKTAAVLHVSPSRFNSNLKLSMVPAGAIFGAIVDSHGEPMPAVIVQALQETYADGESALRLVQEVTSDDLGNYRLFSLPPGKYRVRAILRADPPLSPSYYPSTADIRFAQAIDLQAGSTIGGINITSHFESGVTVRGKVNFNGSGASVELQSRLPITPAAIASSVPVDRNTGTFTIPYVFPGSYFLFAMTDGYSIHLPLEVGTASVPEIQIAIPRPIIFSINITFDSTVTDPPVFSFGLGPPLGRLNFSSRELPSLKLAPGDYEITPSAGSAKIYPRTMRLGSADILNDELHVDSSSGGLIELVMGTHPGSLEGTVRNADGKPEPNAVVVLAPDAAHRRRTDLFDDVLSDDQGRFKIENIPPGDYVAFSWEDVEPTAWMNADFMKDYEKFGKPVHIDADGRQTIQIESIPEK